MCLAIPATIIDIDDVHAMVDVMGIRKKVNIQLIQAPKIGDYILIHAGFGIQTINNEEFVFLNSTMEQMIEEESR